MKRDTSIYVKDILENIERAERFIEGMNYQDFVKDEKTNFAVIRCIEIIGEATKRLPQQVIRRYPNMDWRAMAGMRDKVIHHYFGVDYGIVWDVAKNKAPLLREQIQEILQRETERGDCPHLLGPTKPIMK